MSGLHEKQILQSRKKLTSGILGDCFCNGVGGSLVEWDFNLTLRMSFKVTNCNFFDDLKESLIFFL